MSMRFILSRTDDYRINLGFWWGVGMHIFNNLPAIVLLISL